jgi:hypothetical protein
MIELTSRQQQSQRTLLDWLRGNASEKVSERSVKVKVPENSHYG